MLHLKRHKNSFIGISTFYENINVTYYLLCYIWSANCAIIYLYYKCFFSVCFIILFSFHTSYLVYSFSNCFMFSLHLSI